MKKIDINVLYFFGVSITLYFAQNLFFITAAARLSSLENPLVSLGNLLLIAMAPFFISGFFIAPYFDRVPSRLQLLGLKASRAAMMLAIGLGIYRGFDATALIYMSVIVFDLAFYLFQSTSAKVSKELSARTSIKLVESLSLLGMQLGMISGGLVAGLLVARVPIGGVFLLCGLVELIGLYWSAKYQYGDEATAVPTSPIAVHRNILNSLQTLKNNVTLIPFVLSFSLILPIIQVLNLISGPWAQFNFHDSGRTLGWLSAGIAFGACIGSLALLRYLRLRNAKAMHLAPLIIAASIFCLYLSTTIPSIIASSIALGIGFAWARVAVRSAFIDVAPKNAVSALSMFGLMVSILISALSVVSLRGVDAKDIGVGFGLLFGLAGLQCALLIAGYLLHRPATVTAEGATT